MAKVPQKVALEFDLANVYGVKLLRGIVRYSKNHGPWVFHRGLGPVRQYIEPPLAQVRRHFAWLMNEWGPDALIVSEGYLIQDTTLLKQITQSGLPCIIFVSEYDQINSLPAIRDDDETIGKMAAEHLLDRGFRNFAFYGPDRYAWSRDRHKSYAERLAQAGLEAGFYDWPEWPILPSSRALRAFHEWLKSLQLPVAVMGANDTCAREVTEACKNINLRVPEDVAVIGVDNDDMSGSISYPPLSSVNVDTGTAGYEAAELLDEMMAGRKCANKSILAYPTHVVTRRSTDTLAVEDPEVAEAIHFIHENVHRPLQVTEVADATGLSRRSLQYRFQEVLRRSVSSEIKRSRIDNIKQMLRDTDISLVNIAIKMGCSDVTHLSRYFRPVVGMTPLEYRNKFGGK